MDTDNVITIIHYILLQFTPHYYKIFADKADDSNFTAIKDFLQKLDNVVKSHPGGFMGGGDSPAAVDYLIWPWIERYGALKILCPSKFLSSCDDTSRNRDGYSLQSLSKLLHLPLP